MQDSDVHISFEDQQKINKFARLNARVDDYKDELKVKQNDVKNLEEAVEELALTDDTEKIPYLVGEVFICQSLEDTLVREYIISQKLQCTVYLAFSKTENRHCDNSKNFLYI